MQALIDFDGWRKWKDFSQSNKEDDASSNKGIKGSATSKKKRSNRMSVGSNPGVSTPHLAIKEGNESGAGGGAGLNGQAS